jgi:hypothetical protein
VLHQAEPPSEAQQPSNHDSGGESHHELDSMPSVAKVAHASRVGRVKRDPAFWTTTWDLIPQRLHATSATEMTGVHIARTRSVGVNRLSWVGFATCHGCAPACAIELARWDRHSSRLQVRLRSRARTSFAKLLFRKNLAFQVLTQLGLERHFLLRGRVFRSKVCVAQHLAR